VKNSQSPITANGIVATAQTTRYIAQTNSASTQKQDSVKTRAKLTFKIVLANAIKTSAVCLRDTKRIVSYITMTAVRNGPGAQRIFSSTEWLSHVIIHAELAVWIQRLSQNVAVLKGRCLKIHVVATPTVSATMVLRNLLSVRTVYSITVPHIPARIAAAANVPNCLPEILNVVFLQLANQNHNVQTQLTLYICCTLATASFSTRGLTVFHHAVAALSNIDVTWIRLPGREQLGTVPEEFCVTKNLIR